jgi:hypothetical protein
MSRTQKDWPDQIRWPDARPKYDSSIHFGLGYHTLPMTASKVKRTSDINWKWYKRTPSAWTRIQMTRPKRRACRVWELKTKYLLDFEEADCPDFGRKPHVYYY